MDDEQTGAWHREESAMMSEASQLLQVDITEGAAHSTRIVRDMTQFPEREQLNTFLKSARYTHYQQSLRWYQSLAEPQNYFYLITYAADGKIVAASLVRQRYLKFLQKAKYYIERGPVFDTCQSLDAHLTGMLSRLVTHGIWIRLCPYVLPEDSAIAEVLQRHGFDENSHDHSVYHATVLINLQQSLEAIKSGFRRSLRTQINKAQREDVTVAACSSEREFLLFLVGLNCFRTARGLPIVEQAEGLSIYHQLLARQEQDVLLLAYYKTEVVAGIALFGSNHYLIYEWGFSSHQEEHRKLPLSHVLHWAGIIWAQEKQYHYYDFGGYWLEYGEEDSINRFKSGFSSLLRHVMKPRQKYLSPVTGWAMDIFSRLQKTAWMSSLRKVLPV